MVAEFQRPQDSRSPYYAHGHAHVALTIVNPVCPSDTYAWVVIGSGNGLVLILRHDITHRIKFNRVSVQNQNQPDVPFNEKLLKLSFAKS